MKAKKMSWHERNELFKDDSKYRREIFEKLLNHLEQGYSLDCFEHCSENAIRNYLKIYPQEWCEEELIVSQRKGKSAWETIGKRQATGDCLGNSRSWFYNMANRYGWREKIDIEAEHKGQVSVNIVSYATSKQLTDTQEDD